MQFLLPFNLAVYLYLLSFTTTNVYRFPNIVINLSHNILKVTLLGKIYPHDQPMSKAFSTNKVIFFSISDAFCNYSLTTFCLSIIISHLCL